MVEKEPEPVAEKEPEPNDFLFEESSEEEKLPEIQNETENEEDIFQDSPEIQTTNDTNDLEMEDVDGIFSDAEPEYETNKIYEPTADKLSYDIEAFRIIETILLKTKHAIALIDNASQNIKRVNGRNEIAKIKEIINTEVNEIYSKEDLLTEFERNSYIIDKLTNADVEGTTIDLVSIINKNICNVGKVDLEFSSKVLKGFVSVLEKMNGEPQLLQIEADKFIGTYANIPECFLENEGAGKKTRRKKIKKKQRKNKTKRNKK